MPIGNGQRAMRRVSVNGRHMALDTGIGICGKAGGAILSMPADRVCR